LARVLQNAEWDWAGAEREYRRCIELEPDYALGHSWYGSFLASIYGRFDEAIREGERAVELDPFSPANLHNLAGSLNMSGQEDQAAIMFRRAIALEPDWWQPHRGLANALGFSGNFGEAFAEIQRTYELATPVQRITITADFAFMLARSGDKVSATKMLEDLMSQPETPPFHLARVHAGLGDQDNALRILEHGVLKKDRNIITLRGEWFASLHANPRFTRLLALYESGSLPPQARGLS
jgi:tetratricopeptide (TPR) repeat protein